MWQSTCWTMMYTEWRMQKQNFQESSLKFFEDRIHLDFEVVFQNTFTKFNISIPVTMCLVLLFWEFRRSVWLPHRLHMSEPFWFMNQWIPSSLFMFLFSRHSQTRWRKQTCGVNCKKSWRALNRPCLWTSGFHLHHLSISLELLAT